VFIPKYRTKAIYGALRHRLGDVFADPGRSRRGAGLRKVT
jgi:hypothetical protein